MNRKGEDGKKFTLRISERLGRDIDEYVKNTGMSVQEFVRRACREKLDREQQDRSVGESSGSYLSQEDFNRMLKAALSNPDIRKIILTIIKN